MSGSRRQGPRLKWARSDSLETPSSSSSGESRDREGWSEGGAGKILRGRQGMEGAKEQAAEMEKRRKNEKISLRGRTPPASSSAPPPARSASPKARFGALASQGSGKGGGQERARSPGRTTQDPKPERITMPRNLTSYQVLPQLLNLLEPFAKAKPGVSFTPADSVSAMNRIKRLSQRGGSQAELARADSQMFEFAGYAVKGMHSMNGKNVGLAVNAVCEKGKDYHPLMRAASRRAEELAGVGAEGSIDVQGIAMILNGFARGGQQDKKLFSVLSGYVKRRVAEDEGFREQFNAQAVSVIVNAFVKAGCEDRELFSLLSGIALQIPPDQFSSQAVANLLNAFARHNIADADLFLYMGEVSMYLDPWVFQSQHIAIIVNAFAKARVHNDRLFAFFADEIVSRDCESFDYQAIANILNAYARNYGHEADPRLFVHFKGSVKGMRPRTHDAQNVASILNSCVKADQADPELFRRLSQVAQRLNPLVFDAQAVSNIVHSFAKAEIRDDALFAAMSGVARGMSYMFEGQSVALILNAYARLGYKDNKLLAHLSRVARSIPAEGYECQHVENILNAFARLEYKDHDLCRHMASVILSMRPDQFDPQAIAIVLNSFAKIMPHDALTYRVCDFFSSEVLPQQPLESFEPTSVSVILNAYAKIEVRDERAFELMSKAIATVGVDRFEAHNIANLFHAFASLNIRDLAVMSPLTERLMLINVADMRPEEIAVIAWSSSVLHLTDERLIRFLIGGIDEHIDGMETNFLRQAHQFLLTCELDGLLDSRVGPQEHDVLRIRSRASPAQVEGCDMGAEVAICRQAFASDEESTRRSRLQGEVASVLRAMGIDFEEEYVDNHSGYSLDLLLKDFACKEGACAVAIEVDGPSHYAVGTHQRLGRTVMKRRHVQQMGYDLRTLPYWEWDVLETEEEKEVYLRQLLHTTATPTVTLSN
uniref:RAP domain-containing protein n=2 Tax=Hemiselmis andersenii TaxID=464988 RepID=A0A7S0UB28_HEMAN